MGKKLRILNFGFKVIDLLAKHIPAGPHNKGCWCFTLTIGAAEFMY
jgi:hypothetical protein